MPCLSSAVSCSPRFRTCDAPGSFRLATLATWFRILLHAGHTTPDSGQGQGGRPLPKEVHAMADLCNVLKFMVIVAARPVVPVN